MKSLPEVLFHGSCIDFDQPKPGADGLFWTAEQSTVAQNYIPASGSTVSTVHLFESDMNQRVVPHQNDPYYAVVRMLGHEARNIEHDRCGRAIRYRFDRNYPTYRDVVNFIETELGYVPTNPHPKSYELKRIGWDAVERMDKIAPADYRMPGHLLLVRGPAKMKLFDMTGEDGDLQRPQHLRLGSFDNIKSRGFSGVIINDFCQSKSWGNVGHRSWGFFEHAIGELLIEKIPAQNFDWPNTPGGISKIKETAEFTAWKNANLAGDEVRRHRREFSADQLRHKALTLHT